MRSQPAMLSTKSTPKPALTAARATTPAPLTLFPGKLFVSEKTAVSNTGSFFLETGDAR